jgi:hypothetical protein
MDHTIHCVGGCFYSAAGRYIAGESPPDRARKTSAYCRTGLRFAFLQACGDVCRLSLFIVLLRIFLLGCRYANTKNAPA